MSLSEKCPQPNLVRVCADVAKDGELAGTAYTLFSPEPICFADTWELLRGCDRYFDWLNYPQPALALRHFGHEKKRTAFCPPKETTAGQLRALQRHKGKACAFYLAVDTRRAATWQGRLILPEREIRFFS